MGRRIGKPTYGAADGYLFMIRETLALIVFFFMGAATPAIADETTQAEMPASQCGGILTQGGLVICTGALGTVFTVAGETLTADATGSAQFGLSRAAPSVIGWSTDAGAFGDLAIAPRHDKETILTGISCDKIDARSEEQKAHAGRSWVKKQDGWKTFVAGDGALNGFIQPSEGRISSPFGFIRKYVTEGCPEKISPHFGYDIAAPTGSPIIAPAAGTVILAEDDLYYEGGTVFLDHGQGLVSLFLHMSELNVVNGDIIAAGDPIGKIGATGRVTGPHLHWAVKWRDTGADGRDGDFYIDPALLLELPRTAP